VRLEQRIGDYVPLDAQFTDEHSRNIQLRDVFGKRPVLLLLVFFKCPGVCTDEITNLVKVARDFKKDNVGSTFDVVCLSIEPKETPDLALAKRDLAADFYNRKGTDAGWHFLVGDKQNIDKVANAVGFKYTRDPLSKNIVHPAGLMVLSPSGRLTRYFVTTEYPPRVVLDSIRDAAKEKLGVKDDRPFYLACINIDPMTGQQSLNILNVVRLGGIFTVLTLAISIFMMSRGVKKRDQLLAGGFHPRP